MSYLQSQINAFKTDLTSSSSKISNKRTLAAPATSLPSPTPSNGSANTTDLKRKREGTNVIYSQPINSGSGHNIMSQVHYAVDYLKGKEKPQTIEEIFDYLSLRGEDEHNKPGIKRILQSHDKVVFDRQGAGGKGTYTFRPMHNIRSKNELLGFLQRQPTAQGLSVRELKDGWAGATDAIKSLQDDGKLLVTRNKKDLNPKMIWSNDPSLSFDVDSDFQVLWHKVRLPEANDLTVELERAGLVPTSKSKPGPAKPKDKAPKRKKPRAGGKITNQHMAGVLRDYSK